MKLFTIIARDIHIKAVKVKITRLFLAIVLLCLVSCQSREDIPEVEAQELAHITELPDSSFFSDLRQLTVSGNRIYALDVDRRQVLSLDKDLGNLQVFGSGGRGPTELTGPFTFALQGGLVLIHDSFGCTVKYYDMAGYKSKRSVEFTPDDYRWYAKGDEFWMHPRITDSLIVRSSPKRDRFFGEPHRFGTERKTSIMNTCSVLDYMGEPLMVYTMQPYARHYSVDGALKREIDLSGAEFYGRNMAYIASRPTEENSAYILHQDAVTDGSSLYILCPRYGDQYLVDRIVEIDLPSGRTLRVIRLPKGVYNSIAVDKDTIYAFNSRRCSLDVLAINQQPR